MLEAVTLGFLTGIFLSLGFGSVFFVLIQDSIDYGYRTGIKIALGVVIGDILLVTFALLGTSFLPSIPNFPIYSRLVGAILLIILGISQFKKKKVGKSIHKLRVARLFYFVMKGFVLNIINPMNFIAWMITSATLKGYRYSAEKEIVFFSICILTIFLAESLISFFAHQLKKKLNENLINKISILTGIIFIGLGAKLLIDAFSII